MALSTNAVNCFSERLIRAVREMSGFSSSISVGERTALEEKVGLAGAVVVEGAGAEDPGGGGPEDEEVVPDVVLHMMMLVMATTAEIVYLDKCC